VHRATWEPRESEKRFADEANRVAREGVFQYGNSPRAGGCDIRKNRVFGLWKTSRHAGTGARLFGLTYPLGLQF
jgi:hypothetical protein